MKTYIKRLIIMLLLPWLQAQAALTPQEADQRYYSLSKELRCLVCQNESLAESPAGLADDLRQEVRAQINSGKSDAQIKDYLVERYGYFVLYKPPFIGRTLLLWLAPLLILLGFGGWMLLQLMRKQNTSIDTDTYIEKNYQAQLEKIRKEFEKDQK